MISKIVAKVIRHTLPANSWYRAAFLFTKYYARVTSAPDGSYISSRYDKSYRLNHALKLETVLSMIVADTTPAPIFPIPIQANEQEFDLLKKERPNGLLICSIHIPLNLASIRYIIDQGLIPDAIVARLPPEDGYFTVTGTSVRIPVIPTDASVLIKVRSLLRKGGAVIVLVDNLSDGSFSSNVFRLAEKLNANIVLALVELQADGNLKAYTIGAPDTVNPEEDKVEQKIKSMNEQVLTILEQQ